MWHLIWNNLLYVATNSYGEYRYTRSQPFSWESASVWAYIIPAGLVVLFIAFGVYAFWDSVSGAYWRHVNRNKIKAVTIRVNGKDMSEYKFAKTTEDINAIMAGDRLPGIRRMHKLSAADIVGMSTVPQHDCFLLTVWYK